MRSFALTFAFVAVLTFPFAAYADQEELIDQGKHLVLIMACNDCHTAGFPEAEGQIPEKEWLEGSSVGWRGPWGTTYASNLRTLIHSVDEKAWIRRVRGGGARPPMPWYALQALSDAELKALYAYIHSLGPSTIVIPSYVPPGREPETLYVDMQPKLPGGQFAPTPTPTPDPTPSPTEPPGPKSAGKAKKKRPGTADLRSAP
jgi:mono/diheme cytochrome c family protein